MASAVAWVRENAAQTHTAPEKIAVIGFSAGGHAAGSLGVLWPKAELWQPLGLTPEQVKPNAMVLCYPVITGGEFAHRGSFVNLTGTDDLTAHAAHSLDALVTPATPPTFLWHTFTDGSVPVQNSIRMAHALADKGVLTEMHIFPEGVHGLSLANELTARPDAPELVVPECQCWPELAARFLKNAMKK